MTSDDGTLVSGFLVAFMAAILAVVGNGVLLRLQTKARVREELRQFVRDLHSDTVTTVVDLDLFLRSLRSPAMGGPYDELEHQQVRDRIENRWEQDLLARMRQLGFGHPDPDVRAAAEDVEHEMWAVMGMARRSDERGFSRPPTLEERIDVLRKADEAMASFRLAVYNAPRRDVPRRHLYTGYGPPSRLAQALRDEGMAGVESSDPAEKQPFGARVLRAYHRIRR